MKWKKAPDALKALMEKAMEGIESQKRIMFGYPAWFIKGNMFAGLFQDLVFLRLSSGQVAELRSAGEVLPHLEPMPGRPMKDYHVIPQTIYSNARRFGPLLKKAAQHARSLPEKVKARSRKPGAKPAT